MPPPLPRILSLLLLLPLTTFAADNPIVKDSSAGISYRGILDSQYSVEEFHNIYYGADTSGKNRFSAPVPFVYEKGTEVDATSVGAWCPQYLGGPPLPFAIPITNVSENCLALTITRPVGTKGGDNGDRLPVVVFIHGGEWDFFLWVAGVWEGEGARLVHPLICPSTPLPIDSYNHQPAHHGITNAK